MHSLLFSRTSSSSSQRNTKCLFVGSMFVLSHLAAIRQPVASEVRAHTHVVLRGGEEGRRRAVELLALLAPLVAAAQILVRRKYHVDLRRPCPLGHIHCRRSHRHVYLHISISSTYLVWDHKKTVKYMYVQVSLSPGIHTLVERYLISLYFCNPCPGHFKVPFQVICINIKDLKNWHGPVMEAGLSKVECSVSGLMMCCASTLVR